MLLVIASGNGLPGIEQAMQVLRQGGTAINAVEAGIRLVESNADDDSVGLGGLPNLLGQVELDASIMEGRTLAAGTVGALQGYEHPISVARRVMELSPHVMLVGAGANRSPRQRCCDEADEQQHPRQRSSRGFPGPSHSSSFGSALASAFDWTWASTLAVRILSLISLRSSG